MKLFAKIPEYSDDGIKFLIIESAQNNTGGYYLFFHRSLEEPCEADLWFPDIDSAKNQAKFNYEINFDEWKDF